MRKETNMANLSLLRFYIGKQNKIPCYWLWILPVNPSTLKPEAQSGSPAGPQGKSQVVCRPRRPLPGRTGLTSLLRNSSPGPGWLGRSWLPLQRWLISLDHSLPLGKRHPKKPGSRWSLRSRLSQGQNGGRVCRAGS